MADQLNSVGLITFGKTTTSEFGNSQLKIGLITESPIKTKVHAECIKSAELAAKYCEDLGHDVETTQWNFDGRELMRAFIKMNWILNSIQNLCPLQEVALVRIKLIKH